MTRHCDRRRIQDYLDGELSPAAAASFRAHAEECPDCAAELALCRRTFQALDRLALASPPATLGERVLARVLPSRIRRRWIMTVGLGYAGVLAVSLAAVLFWVARPGTRVLLAGAADGLSRRFVHAMVFALDALAFTVVRLVDGFGLIAALEQRLAPLGRAGTALLSLPGVQVALATAAAVCVALLLWIRQRGRGPSRGVRHVGVLGI
jgi:anti-sigma factor RsiW